MRKPVKDSVEMQPVKKIALIAHDSRKAELVEWIKYNLEIFKSQKLYATGTTGQKIKDELNLDVHLFRSGPLGGDQQVGAKISEGEIDFMIFFWDPLEAQPHDVDVKALLRLAVVYNIPVACNRSTADFVISSQLMDQKYERRIKDYHKLFPA